MPIPSNIDFASLRAKGIFAGLDDDALETLAASLAFQVAESGQCIFEEGDAGAALYVVVSGCVELRKRCNNGDQAFLTTIEAGDWFGDVALLGITSRAVAATAQERCELWSLHARDLRTLYQHNLKAYALLVMNIARELARRLQLVEGEVIQLRKAQGAHDAKVTEPGVNKASETSTHGSIATGGSRHSPATPDPSPES